MNEFNSYDNYDTPFVAKMLTTSDNPYDPFDQFDEWYQFDTTNGYNTCGLIARFLPNSKGFDTSSNNETINSIVDRIIKIDVLNQYTIVAKEITPKFINASQI